MPKIIRLYYEQIALTVEKAVYNKKVGWGLTSCQILLFFFPPRI